MSHEVLALTGLACSNSTLLFKFIEITKDGYGIFDKDDNLIYGNYAFMDIFCMSPAEGIGKNFCDVVRHAFIKKRGIHIESENIDEWLKYVETVRRSSPYRIFEVDLVDGRWLLFSEQLLESGELLVQTKDITRQKVTETNLKNSVSKLHKLALTDELTQLANRRCFVDSVESELSRCRRDCGFVTMLVIDLDFFKIVNDSYGHLAGDTALVHIADILKRAIRQYDIVGRIGGEEFAIFLGSTDVDTALTIAERIRSMIASTPLIFEGQKIVLTTSIGMTSRSCKASFEQLYTEADEALYLSKSRGRNRVEVYSNDIPDKIKHAAG